VNTETSSACATANCELCKFGDNAVLIVIKIELVTELVINPIIRTRTRFFRHAYPHSCDNIKNTIAEKNY
jgi:hypothetical protein